MLPYNLLLLFVFLSVGSAKFIDPFAIFHGSQTLTSIFKMIFGGGKCFESTYADMRDIGAGSIGLCKDCPRGWFSLSEGQHYCVSCPVGRYMSDNFWDEGRAWISYDIGVKMRRLDKKWPFDEEELIEINNQFERVCRECDDGKYQDEEGQMSCDIYSDEMCTESEVKSSTGCTTCQPGLEKFDNYNCVKCGQGKYSDSNSDCKDCPKGYWQGIMGSTYCISCPEGHWSQVTQSASDKYCEKCPVGFFQNPSDDKDSCKQCSTGQYQDQSGQTSCKVCSAGKYQDLDKQTSCKPCPPAKYQDNTGQDSCKWCSKGEEENTDGTACEDCDAGKYFKPDKLQCHECPIGFFQSSTRQTVCEKCPLGKYQDDAGGNTCKSCGKGNYVNDLGSTKASDCEQCPSGKQGVDEAAKNIGDVDIIVGSAYYKNTGLVNGVPQFQKDTSVFADVSLTDNDQPCLVDYDDDGDVDIFIGRANGDVEYWQNTGTRGSPKYVKKDTLWNFGSDESPAPEFVKQHDYLLVGTKSQGVYKFITWNGELIFLQTAFISKSNFQTDTNLVPRSVDFDNDGVLDLIISATTVGGRTRVWKVKAADNPEQAFTIDNPGQVNLIDWDFDGDLDIVMSQGNDIKLYKNNIIFEESCEGEECDCVYDDHHKPPLGLADGQTTTPRSANCDLPLKDRFIIDYFDATATPDHSFTVTSSFVYAASVNDGGCVDCQKGYYQGQTGQQQCTACVAGKYTDIKGLKNCTNCDTGKFSTTGISTQESDCKNCPAGQYSSEAALGNPNSNNYQDTWCKDFIQGCINGLCDPDKFTCNEEVNIWGFGSDKLEWQNSPNINKFTPGCTNSTCSVDTFCRFCPAGKFSDTNALSTCKDCPRGWQQPFPGQQICVKCEKGRFNGNNGQSTCTKCPVGKYADQEGAKLCDDCEYGKYNNFVEQNNISACLNCPVGQSSWNRPIDNPPYHTFDMVCSDNSNRNQSVCESPYIKTFNQCFKCPKGSYQDESGKPTCKVCPSGYYSDREAQDTGTALDRLATQNVCKACLNGRYRKNKAVTGSKYIPTIHFPTEECTESCPVGKYSTPDQWVSAERCITCPLGFYTNFTGSGVCNQCPSGKTMVTNYNKQIVDEDEYYMKSFGISYATQRRKLQVVFGVTPDTRLYSDCQDCPAGKYKKLVSASVDNGERSWRLISNVTLQSEVYVCELCPIGKFSTTVGAMDDSTCHFCTAGKRSVRPTPARCADITPSGRDKNSCTMDECKYNRCDISKRVPEYWNRKSIWLEQNTVGGATECTDCLTGTNSAQEEYTWQQVVGCPAIDPYSYRQDVYVDGCPQKTWTNGAWTYPAATINPECTDSCPKGQGFNLFTGCEACPVGKYNSNEDISPCDACPPGKYLDTTGNDALADCKQCTAGKYTNIDGAVTCDVCPEGTYQDSSGETTCKSCPKGKYLDTTGNGALVDCKNCPLGKPDSELGSDEESDCLPCLPGKYSPGVGKSCQLCEKGRFQNQPAQTECKTCPAGQFSEQVGNTECKDCGPGQYNSRAGRSTCKYCPTGKYSSETTNTVCAVCQNSTVPLANQTGCESCPAGKQIIGRKCVETSSCKLVKYGYENSNCACDDQLD